MFSFCMLVTLNNSIIIKYLLNLYKTMIYLLLVKHFTLIDFIVLNRIVPSIVPFSVSLNGIEFIWIYLLQYKWKIKQIT